MKFKKIIMSILIIFIIININSHCSAKYVFEYTQTAAEISINN